MDQLSIKENSMSKIRSYIIPLMVAFLLLAATVACGGESSVEKVGQVEAQEETTSQTDENENNDTEEISVEEETDDIEPTTGPEKYAVGDLIQAGDMMISALGWEIVDGDDFSQPEEGNMFIAVELIFVNGSDEAETLSSMLQMSLRDETGQKYDESFTAAMALDETGLDGEISPGEKLRGKVAFEVPQDFEELVFVYDIGVFSSGKAFVDLGTEPASVEPPEKMAGETEQETYQIGDVIKADDMTITINEVYTDNGDEFFGPKEGFEFLVVDVMFENLGDDSEALSSLLQMYIKNPAGNKFDLDLMASASSGGTMPDGEIAAGEKIRGQVGFEVPADAEELTLVFDVNVFTTGKIFVDIR
jgi:hypothetical protein